MTDEFAHPDYDGPLPDRLRGWVPRDRFPDPNQALAIASDELGIPLDRLGAVPVLMREESEVEARINGHEFPYSVECSRRARRYELWWRIEETKERGRA